MVDHYSDVKPVNFFLSFFLKVMLRMLRQYRTLPPHPGARTGVHSGHYYGGDSNARAPGYANGTGSGPAAEKIVTILAARRRLAFLSKKVSSTRRHSNKKLRFKRHVTISCKGTIQ